MDDMSRYEAPTRHERQAAITVNDRSFALNGRNVSYRFHVDQESGDLISDHFGATATETVEPLGEFPFQGAGWALKDHLRREFPDLGRGGSGLPAIQIKHASGQTITDFRYHSHTVVDGKPPLVGLPSTSAASEQDGVQTLVVRMHDSFSEVTAELLYSIFPQRDAITRAVRVINSGKTDITVERLASFSHDFPMEQYDMIGLHGDWAREASVFRRPVSPGFQGFRSSTGFSSHFHNPFVAIASKDATEFTGDVWGFSLVYSGSFEAEVATSPRGPVRASIGMNSAQLSWTLTPGNHLTSPECISVFSSDGIGGMSRKLHRLYRHNLMRSKFANEPRPVLFNSWEGVYFDFDEDTIYEMAEHSARLGAKLFALDDGWFGGPRYPRKDDHAGLGDWYPNPERFPSGSLAPLAKKMESELGLDFGLWIEPEMVNPKSELFEKHPEWALHAKNYAPVEVRHQLVLNVGLPEVQDYIIDAVSRILESAPIRYIKWDHNRGLTEISSSSDIHTYILGKYRIVETLTTKFAHVLWEGCGSGGGRFDPGILHYFPQIWTSDNTDPLDRLSIQFGTSLCYPASAMGAHVSAAPNHITGRTTSLAFRAHVALMGGSFGFELDPRALSESEKAEVPELIKLADVVGPIVIGGDMWRLRSPSDTQNHPAVLFVSEDQRKAVLFTFQIRLKPTLNIPAVKLAGLMPEVKYKLSDRQAGVFSGSTLMNAGIPQNFAKEYDSKVVIIEMVE